MRECHNDSRFVLSPPCPFARTPFLSSRCQLGSAEKQRRELAIFISLNKINNHPCCVPLAPLLGVRCQPRFGPVAPPGEEPAIMVDFSCTCCVRACFVGFPWQHVEGKYATHRAGIQSLPLLLLYLLHSSVWLATNLWISRALQQNSRRRRPPARACILWLTSNLTYLHS